MGKIIYEHLGYPISDETFKLERNIELRYINKPRGGLGHHVITAKPRTIFLGLTGLNTTNTMTIST